MTENERLTFLDLLLGRNKGPAVGIIAAIARRLRKDA